MPINLGFAVCCADASPPAVGTARGREFQIQDGVAIACNSRFAMTAWSDLPVLKAA